MKKWLLVISKVLVWLPTIVLIGWVDPELVKDIGWSNSYLPLLLSIGLALDYDLKNWLQIWWQRKISVLIGLLILYLQILRASNWFEFGLVVSWLVYLTQPRLVRILKVRKNEDFKTKFKSPN